MSHLQARPLTAKSVILSSKTSDCYMSHLQARPLTALCHITSDCYMSDLQARPLTVKCHIFKQDL